MKKTFVLHDESVNTYGIRLLTSGANLEEFRKNPVMLLNHNDWSMPIGRWENIRVEGGKILADPVFDDQDVTGREVKGKVERDFIRAASIGAWPPEEVNDDLTLKLEGQTGPTVTKWTLREASIVTIPANHNALVFYDRQTGKPIDLTDAGELIRLFDNPELKFNKNKILKMKELTKILNLADNATESAVAEAVRQVIADRDRLKVENTTLSDRIDAVNKAEKEARKTEATALVDAAIKDGRLDAKAKESTLKLFDADHDSAKSLVENLPKRPKVTKQIEQSEGADAVELADLQKKSWSEIDKENKLSLLKEKYPDLYAVKFKDRFGVEVKND
ncbi:MAG: HK97 family phage prohead protease [Kiritimatiellales bacterium]